MVVQAVHLWRRGLDVAHMFLDVNYYIQKQYGLRFLSITILTLEVVKRLFAESVFGVDQPADGS